MSSTQTVATVKQPEAYMPVYPKFTPEMKSTHKILIPQMAPIHFEMIAAAMRQDGYRIEVLENGGPEVAQEGLKYVHNDTCYPALLVIGQFIDALKSGKYDLDHTALMITQTGGGCRASNYIHLLRKALVKAGFPQVPVASLNFSGLEKDSGFKYTLPLIRKAIAGVFYGDELMSLSNQLRPYENTPGSTDALVKKWQQEICTQFESGKGVNKREMKKNFEAIADDFALLPVTKVPRVKVGIVGEIYVKYSPLGNSHLEDFLASEGCEVNMPSLMGFIQYCIVNGSVNIELYGGSKLVKTVYERVMDFTTVREKLMVNAIARHPNLHAPTLFEETKKLANGFIGYGAKMGEGWLLTAEMVELVQSGFPNIVCAQPFGCLPNHVVGKAMISKIRAVHPEANITPIDYDPSATKVNQENRIKLMLAVGKERLEDTKKGLTAPPKLDSLPTSNIQLSNSAI
ncbi:MAG: 2-hydroxyglutaryl-CoA dehydratase [Oscillospiraceae bacterium]